MKDRYNVGMSSRVMACVLAAFFLVCALAVLVTVVMSVRDL